MGDSRGLFWILDLLWFRGMVYNDGEWDIKRPHHWETQLPGITFLTLNGTFLFRGRLTDAEAYGNRIIIINRQHRQRAL